MWTPFLGACLVACLAVTAHAEHRTKKSPHHDVKRVKAAKAEPVVETEPAGEPGVLDLNRLRSLTNDPILGNADRIDGDETRGVVAFTFDDGPNPETTPSVIDALEKYDIPTTFFIVTRRLVGPDSEKPREILDRILKAGFEIGSHSVSHRNLKKANAKKLDDEIDTSLRTLAPQANRAIGMFRPPFGAFNAMGKAKLKRLGLTDVRWSIDTLDWKATDADKLRAKVLALILKQHGGVVLMHDVKPITAHIIAGVFDDLEAENCRRLAASQEPIVPVSLHYFLKDGKTARPVPEPVLQRTAAYRAGLPARCTARPPLPPVTAPIPTAVNPPLAVKPAQR